MFKKRSTAPSAKKNARRLSAASDDGPEPESASVLPSPTLTTGNDPIQTDSTSVAVTTALPAQGFKDSSPATGESLGSEHVAPSAEVTSATPAVEMASSDPHQHPVSTWPPPTTNASPALLSYFTHLTSNATTRLPRFSIVDVADKGRGVASLSAFQPGDLLWTESPACALPTTEFTDKACTRCLATPRRVMRCKACARASYCGIECQRADWPEHKLECAHLKGHHYPPVIRMFARLLRMKEAGKAVDLGSDSYVSVWELVEQLQGLDLDMEEAQQMGQGVMMARNLVSNGDFMPPVLAMKFLGQLNNNGITILPHSSSIDPVGLGLFPGTSLVNHSCRPNALAFFSPTNPRLLNLRCLQPISPGDEVTINYVDPCQPEPLRRADLAKYHFTCTCALCVDERAQADRAAVKGKHKPKMTSVPERFTLAEYTRAMRYATLDSRLLQATRRTLVDQLLHTGGDTPDYAAIVVLAKDLVACYAEHIGRGHPTTLVHEMGVLKTMAYLLQGDNVPRISAEQVKADVIKVRELRREWDEWDKRMRVWFSAKEMSTVFSDAHEAKQGVDAFLKAIEGVLMQGRR